MSSEITVDREYRGKGLYVNDRGGLNSFEIEIQPGIQDDFDGVIKDSEVAMIDAEEFNLEARHLGRGINQEAWKMLEDEYRSSEETDHPMEIGYVKKQSEQNPHAPDVAYMFAREDFSGDLSDIEEHVGELPYEFREMIEDVAIPAPENQEGIEGVYMGRYVVADEILLAEAGEIKPHHQTGPAWMVLESADDQSIS